MYVVTGHIGLATVRTVACAALNLAHATLIPVTTSCYLLKDFGLMDSQFGNHSVDDVSVELANLTVVGTLCIDSAGSSPCTNSKDCRLEMLPWHVEHIYVALIVLMDDALLID